MKQRWGPSEWGLVFTSSAHWTLSLSGAVLRLEAEGRSSQVEIGLDSPLTIFQGVFWARIRFPDPSGKPIVVDGIPNAQAVSIEVAVERVAHNHRVAALLEELKQKEIAERAQFDDAMRAVAPWADLVTHELVRHNNERRWITSHVIADLKKARPELALEGQKLLDLVSQKPLGPGSAHARALADIRLWMADLDQHIAERNERFTRDELKACRELFQRVEKRPLTEEQARAAICFENRVLVIAAAGSGKTSTMVAKAAYAIQRELVPAGRILMLAFNKDAADELQARIARSLGGLGLANQAVAAMTFHKLGSDIIGMATGRKKRPASWLESQNDERAKLLEIVDALKDADPVFRSRWDLFRIVLSRDLPRFGQQGDEEDWERNSRELGFRTLNGEIVKSHEERIIADWCFYNGIKYQYEPAYEHDTADAKHSQYRPDFYYPDAKLYHEHFALNRRGEPPPEFKGYLDQLKWKRLQHKANKTALVETTSASLRDGSAFELLTRELSQRGVSVNPNPDRESAGRPVSTNDDLATLFRAFICHAKSNSFSLQDLKGKLEADTDDTFRFRWDLFLDLYGAIRAGWDAALREADAIDYEDMLDMAATHVETGAWEPPYELVMVDEFQDTSYARARLLLAMTRRPNSVLFAVGDDWQSVNRFAGADISVMTGFKEWCGEGQILRLQQTFRCPQLLCDISSNFISKNPRQLSKVVRSHITASGPVVEVLRVKSERKIVAAISKHLEALLERVSKEQEGAARKRASVMILGRYNRDAQYVPRGWMSGADLDVTFSTVHAAKGLEADFVVVANMVKGGFPASREDDPLLMLAMPAKDDYPHSEERRLFYVALTRARRSVALVTIEGQESVFVLELAKGHKMPFVDLDGQPSDPIICDQCGKGVMVEKVGKYGPFLSCSNFPPCRNSRNLGKKGKSTSARG